MTNRRYSERTLTPSTNPLTGMALIGVSTTNDGGLTYNASIKSTFDEFVEWLLDNGIPIDDDLIVVGTGTGIEGSTGKAGGVAGYPNDFILAHKDHHSVTNYMSWQEETGNVYHNVPEGNTMYITAGGSTLLKLRDGDDEGLQICNQDAKKVVIGNTLESSESIAKLHIRGAGNDILTLSAEGAVTGAFCFTVGEDEKVTLKNGVGVNEISDDSDFSSATNDEVRTALAIKNFVEGLGSLSGTVNTIGMFTPNGDTIGDSPLTVDTGNVQLLSGNLSIGAVADPDTNIYVESVDRFPLFVFQEYIGGEDTDAIFASSQGANAGGNTGVIGRASSSTLLNIGLHGKAGSAGTAKNPEAEGFLEVGSFSQSSGSATDKIAGAFISSNGNITVDQFAIVAHATGAGSGDAIGIYLETSSVGGTAYVLQGKDGTEGIGKVLTCITADGKAQWADPNPVIIGGVTLSSSSNTNILNGTYVILADTTTVTSVTSGISQDSNWTLEITEAGITNQKGIVTFTGNLEKDGGGGANYDVAIFKNGSIVSESEQIDHKLESDGKGQSVTVMAIIEFSTSDTFDIRVSGNGTANDIFCGGGSLYIQ